jgi:lysozyme
MAVKITKALQGRIFAALIAAGVSTPVAYVAVDHTVPSEGFMTELHLDPVGKATTGIGHLVLPGEKPKQTMSEQEVIDQFVKDWVKHQNLVSTKVKVPYRTEWMKGAVIDFTFNKGIGNLSSSTLLKDLNAQRYDKACERLTDWVYGTVKGKKVKLPGLVIRASEQYKYCMGEVPGEYKVDLRNWGYGKEVL